jgi:hypothetical protein
LVQQPIAVVIAACRWGGTSLPAILRIPSTAAYHQCAELGSLFLRLPGSGAAASSPAEPTGDSENQVVCLRISAVDVMNGAVHPVAKKAGSCRRDLLFVHDSEAMREDFVKKAYRLRHHTYLTRLRHLVRPRWCWHGYPHLHRGKKISQSFVNSDRNSCERGTSCATHRI